MSQIKDYPGLAENETAWEWHTDAEVCIQWPCPDCDRGLLLAPARFCPSCSGSGKQYRIDPASPDSRFTDEEKNDGR